MVLGNILIYLNESKKLKKDYAQSFNIRKLWQFFRHWHNCLADKKTPLVDERPWITFEAIEFFERILTKDMRVFEYGSGGSTLFLIKRVKQVISIEHNPLWFKKVSEVIKIKGYNNWHGHLVEPVHDDLASNQDPSDPNGYVSSVDCFLGKSFTLYATSIDEYPESYFDVVLIDGRARPSCFKHAIKKIKPNGIIMWDNTDRDYYHAAMKQVPVEFEFIDFPGPSPYVNFFTRTSVWHRKSKGCKSSH